MHTLDRMMFLSFFRSYFIVLVSLLSLYVVIDLFTNLDDFSEKGEFGETINNIIRYYGVRVCQIFDRLSEAISLLAAMFTVSWLQRNNELLPQLSAGISTGRVIRPIIFGALMTLSLGPLNQEFLIPSIADELQSDRNDPDRLREVQLRGTFDSTGIHLEGGSGNRQELRVKGFSVTFPDTGPTGMSHVTAEEAIYIPPGESGPAEYPNLSGGWILYQTTPAQITEGRHESLLPLGPGRFFLTTRDADFETMTRRPNWYLFASTKQLQDILSRPDPGRLAPVAVLFHMRFTRPLVGALLIILGLSIILRDHNRHVLISTGYCLLTCVLYYAAIYGCKYLGETDLISAPLAAWGPVLLFGPVAVATFDAIQT